MLYFDSQVLSKYSREPLKQFAETEARDQTEAEYTLNFPIPRRIGWTLGWLCDF